MELDEQTIKKIVSRVMEQLSTKQEGSGGLSKAGAVSGSSVGRGSGEGVFTSIEDAIKSAEKAFEKFRDMSLEGRKKIIAAMRKAALENAERLGKMAVETTGLGKMPDKMLKAILAAEKTPGVEDLESKTWTGDHGMTLVEMAPYGVIGSITPTTNPVSTIINNSISMVAAGNSVVFNPHPSARLVSNETVRVLNRAIAEVFRLEEGVYLLNSIEQPTLESSGQLMKHPAIRLLCVTGGGEVVKLAMTSGKKVIAAGPGNPPVIVDETADIPRAAKAIVDGA
ncbi:MAG: aldehyde dehydrogenase family protein, partial [Thermoplasmata archaeon]